MPEPSRGASGAGAHLRPLARVRAWWMRTSQLVGNDDDDRHERRSIGREIGAAAYDELVRDADAEGDFDVDVGV